MARLWYRVRHDRDLEGSSRLQGVFVSKIVWGNVKMG